MAGKFSNDVTLWSHWDDLSFCLICFSMQEGSAPADEPDQHKNTKMHHDIYKLKSCTDAPLSAQIR